MEMFELVLSVSDWPIIMIGRGGLLLVVLRLFAVPVSVLLLRFIQGPMLKG